MSMTENRQAEATRETVRSTDGTEIPFWRHGSGRPLLLVHGGYGSHESWDGLRPYLEDHVTVVTMDRRSAFGDPFAPYDLEREFEDIVAVAATLGDEVDLLGHSSGAVCSLGAAPLLPNLRRLVLHEPPWVDDHVPASVSKLHALLVVDDLDSVTETFLRELVRLSEAEIAAYRSGPMWAYLRERGRLTPKEMAALAAWRIEPERFRSLRASTLYLAGDQTPAGHHCRTYIGVLNGVIPDFRVEEIPRHGHEAIGAEPQLFASMTLAFLLADGSKPGM